MNPQNVTGSSLATYEDSDTYRKTTLNNGIRIVTEGVQYLHSVSLGIWVRSGSRFECPDLNGICHFIEHMLFKGTQRRSALAIAKEIDSVGGAMNAFTSKELTSFYCKVLDENLELAADLLTDIFLNSSFPEEEIEREKQVICQEICQLEDSPEELVHEILVTRFWQEDPLGQPILGTIPNIVRLDRDTVLKFKLESYSPEETVICAAGNLDHDRFAELIERHMGAVPRVPPPTCGKAAKSSRSAQVVPKDLEQVHVCLGTEGPYAADERRHAAYILNAILGSGMSSRLFQEVREKRGLAYTVYSFLSSFSDTGMFGVYAACEPSRTKELLSIIGKETMSLAATMTEEDVRTAKNQIRGNVILAMETSDARMNRLAKGEYFFGRYLSLNEIIDSLEAVTLRQLKETAEEIINSGGFTAVALGPLDEKEDLFGLLGM